MRSISPGGSTLLTSLKSSTRRLHLQARSKPSLIEPNRPDIVPKSTFILPNTPQFEDTSTQINYENLYKEEKMTREIVQIELEKVMEKLKFFENLEEELRKKSREIEKMTADFEAEKSELRRKIEEKSREETGKNEIIEALKRENEAILSEISALKLHFEASELEKIAQKSRESLEKSNFESLKAELASEKKEKRNLELLYAELYEQFEDFKHKMRTEEVEIRVRSLEKRLEEKENRIQRSEEAQTLYIEEYLERKIREKPGKCKCKRVTK